MTTQPDRPEIAATAFTQFGLSPAPDPITPKVVAEPPPPPPAPSRMTPDQVSEVVLRLVAQLEDTRAELRDRSQACARLADERADLTREVDALQTLLAVERAQAACACPCHRPDGDPKAVHGG